MKVFYKETRTHCRQCGEELKIKGYWFNQFGMKFYLDYLYTLHSIKHNHNITDSRSFILYCIKINLKAILIILIEILLNTWFIVGIPFRFLFQ